MTSPDIVIGDHRLDTEFFGSHVRHTTFLPDASQGWRRVEVVKTWYRGRELGRGSSATVFLERSEKGEHRAVKVIAKDKSARIDYKRELMAMAMLAKHDSLFVQLFGWYESDDHVHIAMEYISHGHLRSYLEVEISESEAKVITRQLLEGLVIIHQEGFAHRDLKPENVFVVSTSPMWVKIGDFGLAKLARDGTALRTEGGTRNYIAPEIGIDINRDTSEYTNAVDIWALGCITHEMLTQALPFRGFGELMSYCSHPEPPRGAMLSKNISKDGIEFVGRTLAYPPERRITAKDALGEEWLRLEDVEAVGRETEQGPTGLTLPEEPASSRPQSANRDSQSDNGSLRVHAEPQSSVNQEHNLLTVQKPHIAVTPEVNQILEEVLLRLQMSTDDPQKPMLTEGNAVQMLLNGTISMDIRDFVGNTLLHILASTASWADYPASFAVRALVASGAAIDAKNWWGETPLLLTAHASRSLVAKALLELGANTEEPDADGNRPLITAVGQKGSVLVELLLKHGAFSGTVRVDEKPITPLHMAAEVGLETVVETILQNGADVNARDSEGRTPLHRAAIKDRLEMASILILAGADVGARDSTQRTALNYAVAGNSPSLVKLLSDHDPDMHPHREATKADIIEMVDLFDRLHITR